MRFCLDSEPSPSESDFDPDSDDSDFKVTSSKAKPKNSAKTGNKSVQRTAKTTNIQQKTGQKLHARQKNTMTSADMLSNPSVVIKKTDMTSLQSSLSTVECASTDAVVTESAKSAKTDLSETITSVSASHSHLKAAESKSACILPKPAAVSSVSPVVSPVRVPKKANITSKPG